MQNETSDSMTETRFVLPATKTPFAERSLVDRQAGPLLLNPHAWRQKIPYQDYPLLYQQLYRTTSLVADQHVSVSLKERSGVSQA